MENLASDYLKYHSPGNRYAYFPSTKSWQGGNSLLNVKAFKDLGLTSEGDYGHLYIHLPFCRSLCTFCGCNIKISHYEEDHLSYVKALKKEAYLKEAKGLPLKALTFGGGSPNALHPAALKELTSLINDLRPSETQWHDSLCEIDPKIFDREQFELLKGLGIKRFSIGVQDFDQEICKNVNRHQTLEQLFHSKEILNGDPFGIDLIFGLPKQEIHHIQAWEDPLKDLSPDWVSLYPLAPVPWLAPYQEAYGDFTLPGLEEKASLFQEAHKILIDCDYLHYGLGHYIKKDAFLSRSFMDKELFRSVSGLYPKKHDFTLSLGVGAISEFKNGFHQNERILEKYKVGLLHKDGIPTERHHHLTSKEITFLKNIRTITQTKSLNKDQWGFLEKFLRESQNEEHLWNSQWIEEKAEDHEISESGTLFLKNILQGLEKAYFGLK